MKNVSIWLNISFSQFFPGAVVKLVVFFSGFVYHLLIKENNIDFLTFTLEYTRLKTLASDKLHSFTDSVTKSIRLKLDHFGKKT